MDFDFLDSPATPDAITREEKLVFGCNKWHLIGAFSDYRYIFTDQFLPILDPWLRNLTCLFYS